MYVYITPPLQVPKRFDEAEHEVTKTFDKLLNAIRSQRESILKDLKTLRRAAEALLHNRRVEAEDLKRRVAEVSHCEIIRAVVLQIAFIHYRGHYL